MNAQEISLEERFHGLLEIENTEEILEFNVKNYGFPLWTYIRFSFLYSLLHYNGNPAPEVTDKVQNTTRPEHIYRKKFFTFLPELLKPWPKREIWYLSAIHASYYKYIDNQYIDIYNDPFANIAPEKSLYISNSLGATHRIRKNTYPYRFIQSAQLLLRKTSKYLVGSQDKVTAINLITFLKKRCHDVLNIVPPEHFWKQLESSLYYFIGISIAEYNFFNLLFKYRKPKILILTDAYYGKQSHIIQLAHLHSIKTVEIQHGTVYSMHPAYNWAKTLCDNNRLKKYIVDYFLTFGMFWHNLMQLPGKCQEIGSPWFSLQRERYQQSGDAILFALAGNYDIFKSIILTVLKEFPEKKIILRPHPSEKAIFQRSELAKIPGVTVDTHTDIYETFSDAEVVIGNISTSIYEALALGKRVFVLENDFSKFFYHPLNLCFFKESEDLIDHISNPDTGRITPQEQQSLFGSDWENRYKAFIAAQI